MSETTISDVAADIRARANVKRLAVPRARRCQFSLSDSNFGIQWHIVAMYGPSFFTGSLIARFRASAVVAVGLALEALAAVIGISGIMAMHFWVDSS